MRRAAIAVCAVVAGCGGSTQAGKPVHTARTTPQAQRSTVEVSLRGRDLRTVVFDHALTLTGVARRSGPGAPPRVRLLADGASTDATTAGVGGKFAFTVQPR